MSQVSRATQKRILIWTVTRSLSTVLTRALSEIPDSQVIFEYFLAAAWNEAPDMLVQDSNHEKSLVNMEPDVTYTSVKELYEQPYPGKSLVLGKEMAHILDGRMNVVPSGYTHIFLIRHPSKTIPSLNKMFSYAEPDTRAFMLAPNQFQMLAEMYEFIKKSRSNEKAVVFDADDLTKKPAKAVHLLCEATGMPFSPGLLHWDPITDVPSNWMMPKSLRSYTKAIGYFKNAFESTCFRANEEPRGAAKKTEQVDTEIQEMIQNALHYYEEMYRQRLIVE